MLLSRTHVKYFLCDVIDATFISSNPPHPSSSLSFPQIVCLENTLRICQGPFLPLLSSSWLAVDSMSQRIFAEDSFHIMEKLDCCLLSFPRIPWSSCFSHLLWRITLPIPFILPPYMAKPPNLFLESLFGVAGEKQTISL